MRRVRSPLHDWNRRARRPLPR